MPKWKNPQTGGVPREILRDRERTVWDLRTQGYTQERIADELAIDSTTVSKMLTRLSERASKNLLEVMVVEKTGQIATLNRIIDEAMQAWQSSKKSAEQTREWIEEGTLSKGSISKSVITTLLQDRDGDPRFLEVAIKAMAEIRKILGLDAASKNVNLDIDLSKLTDEQIDRLVAGEDILSVALKP